MENQNVDALPPMAGSAPDRCTHRPSGGTARLGRFPGVRAAPGFTVSRRGAIKLLVGGAVAGVAAPMALATPAAAFLQPGWRWCRKCQGLWFAGNGATSSCPAGGPHVLEGSGNYVLTGDDPNAPGQHGWRWCSKCQGLWFARNGATPVCPVDGRRHSARGSADYVLEPFLTARAFNFQSNWSWCQKCQGLWYAGTGARGRCPAGGGHVLRGSMNYALAVEAGASPRGAASA